MGINMHHNEGQNWKKRKPVFGVGINDANYVTQGLNGSCPYYLTWRGMLQRCYSPKWHDKYPSYKNVEVCKDWHTFSVFRGWMEEQDWFGKQLDKDLLGDGKRYSKETCCFLSKKLNSFLINNSTRSKDDLPRGVYKNKDRYQALCRNPFGGKSYVGNFGCPTSAHFAYVRAKQSHAKRFYEIESDPRIKKAILKRFSL